jgi:hypothetical protein
MKAVMKILVVAAALAAVPAAAGAQTAAMTAYLGNFDVVNNTGEDAHGFEIQFEGIGPNDVWVGWTRQAVRRHVLHGRRELRRLGLLSTSASPLTGRRRARRSGGCSRIRRIRARSSASIRRRRW